MAAAYGIGIASFTRDGKNPSVVAADATVLDTYFPIPSLGADKPLPSSVLEALGYNGDSASYRLDAAQIDALLALLENEEAEHGKSITMALRVAKSALDQDFGLRSPQLPVFTIIGDLDEAAVDAHDVYLRLPAFPPSDQAPWLQYERHLRPAGQRCLDRPRSHSCRLC